MFEYLVNKKGANRSYKLSDLRLLYWSVLSIRNYYAVTA